VFFVNKLPKTRSGKIMRRVLKAVATDASVGDVTTLEDGASVDEVKVAYEALRREI
jgi:acetyl-CoA synthetase